VLRDGLTEAAKASPLAAFFGASWFFGIPWGPISYFLACVYSLIVIAEKLGVLKWIKHKLGGGHGKHPG
jgi:hypothetical protein